MRSSFSTRLAVVSAMFSIASGILCTLPPATAAPPRRPVTISATFVPTNTPTVLATLDNGLVLSGNCAAGSGAPFPETQASLRLAPPATANTFMLVSGFSFDGLNTAIPQSGLKGEVEVSNESSFGFATVGLALIAGPSLDGVTGQLSGGTTRVEVQGTVIFVSPTSFQCVFSGLITPF
jgi:hypothetical protein